MNYLFSTDKISQWITKYGVTFDPVLSPAEQQKQLQEYCNWLIGNFGQCFETLISGPHQLVVQKNFELGNNKRTDIATFALTRQGLIFTFPKIVYVDKPINIEIADQEQIFEQCLDKLLESFNEHNIVKFGVVNELVFDSGSTNSFDIVISNFKPQVWRTKAKNVNIYLEVPHEDKNVNLYIRPTIRRRLEKAQTATISRDLGFGIVTNVDINNRQMQQELSKEQIYEIISFAEQYIPDQLIKFLNNES